MKLFQILFALAATTAGAFAQATYQIDSAHSTVEFAVKHMMVSTVRGTFNKVAGTFSYDPKNPGASAVDAVIDVNTINTREEKRDAHLKAPDFFDAAKHPTMTFKSKQVWKDGAGLKMKGDLTIHGVTREVVFDVEGPTAEVKDPRGGARIGASATTKISRKDFGLTWNRALETGGVVVSDEVAITLDIAGVRK